MGIRQDLAALTSQQRTTLGAGLRDALVAFGQNPDTASVAEIAAGPSVFRVDFRMTTQNCLQMKLKKINH